MTHRLRTTCRLCSGPTTLALELTPTPPANELRTRAFVESQVSGFGSTQIEPEEVFPLPVHTCDVCGHVQLACVVDPERLFRNYPYRSGASPVFVEHLQKYADDLVERFGVPKFVVEIGSNDGTMLRMFEDRGSGVLGVEPADIASSAPKVVDFFTSDAVRKYLGTPLLPSKPDLIIANHVFAHADDLEDIAIGVRELLTDDGVFAFEVGYLVDVLQGTYFDTVYHEHLSYHHLGPLVGFFDRLGMCLYDAHRVDTQGGSIRCFVKKGIRSGFVATWETYGLHKLLEYEREIGLTPETIGKVVAEMGACVERVKRDLLSLLRAIKAEGYKIAGYGAPAKCVTLMHHFGFGNDVLDFIVDDSPVKHGLFTPGKHVEILPVSTLYERKPDYVLVLAWNFAESIMAKNRKFDGSWIVPLPKVVTHFGKRHEMGAETVR
jgi:SAM-dependent methyltransferase